MNLRLSGHPFPCVVGKSGPPLFGGHSPSLHNRSRVGPLFFVSTTPHEDFLIPPPPFFPFPVKPPSIPFFANVLFFSCNPFFPTVSSARTVGVFGCFFLINFFLREWGRNTSSPRFFLPFLSPLCPGPVRSALPRVPPFLP